MIKACISLKEEYILIEVNHLVKRYGNHLAVNDISFTVEKGQIYGFLGPNGAGKSTTMNIITGYIASTEGEVIINGHDILNEPEEAKKSIGYLPEQPPLYFDMTVMEYLKFSAELKKIPKGNISQMIDEVMELVGIKDIQNRLIKNLSKGYKQRVGLAQAILGYPEIIILDEPTVGLDPKQIIEIRDLIKGLSKKHTVILSSHILSEVSAVCDYVLIISNGKLVASDTPDNLSKLASGSNILDIKVKSTAKKMEKLLQQLPEIEEFTFLDLENNENTVDISIKTVDSVDIREKIFYLCAQNKCPILSMNSKLLSLEDVFLELTQSNEAEDGEYKVDSTEGEVEGALGIIENVDEDSISQTDEEETEVNEKTGSDVEAKIKSDMKAEIKSDSEMKIAETEDQEQEVSE